MRQPPAIYPWMRRHRRTSANTGRDGHFLFKEPPRARMLCTPGTPRIETWFPQIVSYFRANESKSRSVEVAEDEPKTVHVKLTLRPQQEP